MNRRKSREREEMEDKKRLVNFFARKRKTTRQKKPNRLQKLFSFFGSDSEQTSPVTLLSKTEFKNKQITLGSSKNVKFLPALEKGGLITEPTEILAGEAGPEAIIPLDQLRGMFLAERRSNASSHDAPQTPKPPELPLGTSSQSKMKINGIVMDRNQDGVITREEAAEARSLRGTSDPLTERVTKAENIVRTQKMAEARGVSVEDLTTGKSDYGNEVPLDLNKDGIVTPEERQVANRRRDEMDLGTIKDRGDEVRASRRNLETEKSLYGGMTREQAVLRFGEGAVRDREDIVMDNATGPQGTEDIRQIERITERDRAGDRDRTYVDDSEQQRYEDSSNQLRDEKQELRDMTLEMNRVSKGAGEFAQVTPSDISDARGRFNQGQREIENQMNEGEFTPDVPTQDAPIQDVPTQDAPIQDVPTQDVPEKPFDPSLLAQGPGGAGGLPGMIAAAAMSSDPSTEKPSTSTEKPSTSTEKPSNRRGAGLFGIFAQAGMKKAEEVADSLGFAEGEDSSYTPQITQRDLLGLVAKKAVEKGTEVADSIGFTDKYAPTPGPKGKPQPDPVIMRRDERNNIRGKPQRGFDPISKRFYDVKHPAVRRQEAAKTRAVEEEKEYRSNLETKRDAYARAQEEKFKNDIKDVKSQSIDPDQMIKMTPEEMKEMGITPPEDTDQTDSTDQTESQVTPPIDPTIPAPYQPQMDIGPGVSRNIQNMNPTALAAAQRANPPMMSPSAFAPTKSISGAADFTTDFGILSLMNQSTPMWRTT
jgi:hypothetical protein